MVRLNLSTMPSDCGCKGVVLVLSIPVFTDPLQYRRDEISSLIGMKLRGTPYLDIQCCTTASATVGLPDPEWGTLRAIS
ncbi:hypothetical protein TNCV_1189401 [Trichonephila clavipes]|nr:hypothetical protein TNCV_1189401 [Trichonephila clavipes]